MKYFSTGIFHNNTTMGYFAFFKYVPVCSYLKIIFTKVLKNRAELSVFDGTTFHIAQQQIRRLIWIDGWV